MLFQELHAQKQENLQIENIRESNNDLLKYLRSLDSDMVIIFNILFTFVSP